MIHVHVGQCGCQLGDEFWSQLEHSFGSDHKVSNRRKSTNNNVACSHVVESIYDNPGGSGRPAYTPAIFVDSEPKVVQHLRCSPRPDGLIFEQNGRGNNWAYGYSGSKKLCTRTLEAIRREMERRDIVQGFNMVHGLSGGTGSGLGSRLLTQLRDSFPKLFLLTTSVGGSNFGDTCLQPYNTLLTLESLQRNADAICYYGNDEIGRQLHSTEAQQQFCKVGKGRKSNDIRFSIHDTNKVIARSMVGLFAPVSLASDLSSTVTESGFSNRLNEFRSFDPGEFVSATVPFPKTKYVSVRCALLPKNTILSSTNSARALVNGVSRTFSKYRQNLNPVKNFKAFWIARGHFEIDTFSRRGQQQNGVKKDMHKDRLNISPAKSFASQSRSTSYRNRDDLFHPMSIEIMKSIPLIKWDPITISGHMSCTRFSKNMGIFSGKVVDATRHKEHHSIPSLTVAINRSAIIDDLRKLCNKATSLLSVNAYVHWYERYNCGAFVSDMNQQNLERNKIEDALDSASSTVREYDKLCDFDQ